MKIIGDEKMRNNSGKVLKHFDNIFNTNTRNNIKQLPLFRVFYEYFADDFYTTDEDTKELITKRTEISKKLKEQLTEEQQKLWEEYWDIDNQIQEELHRNLFLYGYITATELFVETTDKRYKVRNDKT